MIYSRSCEYVIQTLVYLARQPAGHYAPIDEICQQEDIPKSFTGKLLQTLVKQGLVSSRKGPGGGFILALPASEITVLQIVEYIDGVSQLERCVLGMGACRGETCPMHNAHCQIRTDLVEILQEQTIGDLARLHKDVGDEIRDHDPAEVN